MIKKYEHMKYDFWTDKCFETKVIMIFKNFIYYSHFLVYKKKRIFLLYNFLNLYQYPYSGNSN